MDDNPQGLAEAPPISATPGSKPATRPHRSAGRFRRARRFGTRVALLVGLLGLLAWNLTRSDALEQAEQSELRGDFVNALMNALDHLDRRPWSGPARAVAARCLSRLDFADQAEPYYRRGWQPSVEDDYYHAYGLVRANQREQAIAAFDAILEKHPGDVTALRMKAGVLLTQNRWDDVMAVARRLIEHPPGPVTIFKPVTKSAHWTLKAEKVESGPVIGYTLLGLAHHDKGEPEEAVEAFGRVVELDPEFRSMPLQRNVFWGTYADDLLGVSRSSDVIRLLSRVFAESPDVGLLELMGRAHLNQSQFDDAERCWKQALELSPNLFSAYLNLGRIELQRGKPDSAIAWLNRAAELKPGSYEAAYSLALCYKRLGKLEEAKKFQEKARQNRQSNLDAASERGGAPGASSR